MVATRIRPEGFAAQSSVNGRFLHLKRLVYAASWPTAIVRGKSGLDRNRLSRYLGWWTGDVEIGCRRVRAHVTMMGDDVPSLPVGGGNRDGIGSRKLDTVSIDSNSLLGLLGKLIASRFPSRSVVRAHSPLQPPVNRSLAIDLPPLEIIHRTREPAFEPFQAIVGREGRVS